MPQECKIHIVPPLVEGAYGGGNQFAKALRNYFRAKNAYAEDLSAANVVLFNGFPFRDRKSFERVLKWKVKLGNKGTILVRLDGPIAKGRNDPEADYFDRVLYDFSNLAGDAIIIQSDWSKSEMQAHELAPACPVYVIGNAVNPNIFYKPEEKLPTDKLRLITTSWSDNPQKGFPVYEWLDKNLDFDKVEYTIIGNAAPQYENISVKASMPQEELADMLRQHDVFITASLVESCSNASLEALSCGLPVIAPNTSSHPQYISHQDLLFDQKEEIPEKVMMLQQGIDKYVDEIKIETMDDIGDDYLEAIVKTHNSPSKVIQPKKIKEFLKQYGLVQSWSQSVIMSLKNTIKNALFR